MGHSDSWFFRATVGVSCGHSQLLQYLKWFNNTQGENAEFKIKGKPRRGEAAYTEMGKSFGHWCLVCPPDPGWSLLPCPAWRSLGPQCGIALPAWCCMAEGCRPGRGVGPSLAPSMDRPNASGFPLSGGSRMPGAGAGQGREGEAGRPFPVAVLCLVRSHGLPASILSVGPVCVAWSRKESLLCFQKSRKCGTEGALSPCSCPAEATVHRQYPLPNPRGLGVRIFGRHPG